MGRWKSTMGLRHTDALVSLVYYIEQYKEKRGYAPKNRVKIFIWPYLSKSSETSETSETNPITIGLSQMIQESSSSETSETKSVVHSARRFLDPCAYAWLNSGGQDHGQTRARRTHSVRRGA